MKVFKFGGASINNAERFQNTASIIEQESGRLLVVVSAMGKTTNALEKVAEAFYEQKIDEALLLFERVKESHFNLVKYLVSRNWKSTETQLRDIITEVEWLLHDKPSKHFDYYYDQVVCAGELLSSILLSRLLEERKINNTWIDVRDYLRTDNNFRDAAVDWTESGNRIKAGIEDLFTKTNIIITQGFIGSTDENESTTLGREGSDYTAAIFANTLNAESVTIWKDVEAVMNADPRLYNDAVVLPSLNYNEVIEMAYYGAQVIHPKTIKPLQNQNIPLFVKSFLDPSLPGTVINKDIIKNIPPVIIRKENQVLISFKSKDFSFVEGKPVELLHEIFRELKIKSNLSQHTAISLLCVFDDHPEKISQMALRASEYFDVEVEKALCLLTVRHYSFHKLEEFTKGKHVVLEQRTEQTAQIVIR